jgi:putative transposase
MMSERARAAFNACPDARGHWPVPNYRRDRTPGGTWFFTVVTAQRRPWLCTPAALHALRHSFAAVAQRHPFRIVAGVILPDHLHVIWTQPGGDADFGKRWSQIKRGIGAALADRRGELPETPLSSSQCRRHERGLWQRRFWEHRIRDEEDLQHHVEYIHFNPVKHGLARCVAEWPHSSFHRFVANGWLPADWAGDAEGKDDFGE